MYRSAAHVFVYAVALLLLAPAARAAPPPVVTRATCVFHSDTVSGHVSFRRPAGGAAMAIQYDIKGLTPGRHKWHVHSYGDVSQVRYDVMITHCLRSASSSSFPSSSASSSSSSSISAGGRAAAAVAAVVVGLLEDSERRERDEMREFRLTDTLFSFFFFFFSSFFFLLSSLFFFSLSFFDLSSSYLLPVAVFLLPYYPLPYPLSYLSSIFLLLLLRLFPLFLIDRRPSSPSPSPSLSLSRNPCFVFIRTEEKDGERQRETKRNRRTKNGQAGRLTETRETSSPTLTQNSIRHSSFSSSRTPRCNPRAGTSSANRLRAFAPKSA
jgi:hypothetical protein